MLKSAYFWIPFEILINLYTGVISVWYIDRLLLKKRSEKVSLWICSLLICAVYSSFLLVDHLSLDVYFSDSWVFLIIILFAVLFYRDHWAKKLLWLAVLYTVISTAASFSYYLFSAVFKCSYEELLDYGFPRLALILCANLLNFLILFMAVHFFSPIKKEYYMNYRSVIILALINLSAVLVEETLFRLYPEGDLHSLFFFFICTLCLLICLLSMTLYRFLYDYSEKTAKLQFQEQQRAEINERLSEINRMFDTINHLQHDTKKHIDVAMNLFHNGENEKAMEYLGSYIDKFPPMFSTGCLSLDSALTLRARLMEEQTISFLPELCNLSKLPMKDVDFCTIIMNLLDNAIEELNRSKDEMSERYVRLQIRWVRGMLMIRCENPCTSLPIQRTKEGFVSRKRASGVGVGIPIINEIVEEASGVIQIDQQNNHFIVLISLPIDEENLIDATPNPYAEMY